MFSRWALAALCLAVAATAEDGNDNVAFCPDCDAEPEAPNADGTVTGDDETWVPNDDGTFSVETPPPSPEAPEDASSYSSYSSFGTDTWHVIPPTWIPAVTDTSLPEKDDDDRYHDRLFAQGTGSSTTMEDEALRFKVADSVLEASGGVDQRASEEDAHAVRVQGLSPTAGAAVLCFAAALVALAVMIAKHRDRAVQSSPEAALPDAALAMV